MPTQTFFNLPDDKREHIAKAAIGEFANNSYSKASVSRIADQAGVAKGSLYQYFADKKELFLYLVQLAGEEKLRLLQSLQPPDPDLGVFAYLRWVLEASLQVQFQNPLLAKVAQRAVYDDLPFHDETVEQLRAMAAEYMRQLLQKGVAQGEISSDVDLELATWLWGLVSSEFGNYALRRLSIDPAEMLVEGQISVDATKMGDLFEKLIGILECGIGVTEARGGDSR